MDSFMAWVGGKKSLREQIVVRFPLNYERYIEVFGGAGWVLFYKNQGSEQEVFNDYNNHLINLYRCVRDNPNKLKYKLQYMLHSREEHRVLSKLHKLGLFARFHDYDRAAKFYWLVMCSYGHMLRGFSPRATSMWSRFPLIDAAAERLQGVTIENLDFERLIQMYDRPASFFYCDPPYYKTEDFYKDVVFGRKDHQRLHDTLMNCQGKFLVSYNDCPEIRQLWTHPNIQIESIQRTNNMAQRYEAGSQYDELLISNYDTDERAKAKNADFKQLSLLE